MLTVDVLRRITCQIIHEIEAGACEYRMPWHRWGENPGSPINLASGKSYRGINTLLLWAAAGQAGYSSGRWGTFRQWAACDAFVRKGEKATSILFWRRSTDNDSSGDERDERGRGSRILSRIYSVFNADQVEGAERLEPTPSLSVSDRNRNAESFIRATGADIRWGGDRACYVPGVDQIWLPKFEQFRDAESYYSVAAHECVHWAGARHRLARDLSGRFGDEAYAIEELIAELGSAFIAAHLGFGIQPRPDHAAYIASWLQVLRGHPLALLTVSSQAQEAADFLIVGSKG